jgi:hypothetical protein
MIELRLPLEQWQQVLGILAQAPWATANPLIMSLGEQLRAASEMALKRDAAVRRGNGADNPEAFGTG